MLKRFHGELLFGLFMLSIFAAGAYDLIGNRSLDAVLRDTGALFALSIIFLSMILLLVVSLNSLLRPNEEDDQVLITRRGILIAVVGLVYPALFWAAEYLIATFAVGAVVQCLFAGKVSPKPIAIAFAFAFVTYLIFFFLLGLTEPDGALFSTGLNDRMPLWRRDFFASF